MMGLGKLKLHTKFEVASFSRYKNIKGEPQNIRELAQPRTTHTFSSRCDFVMGLGEPKQRTKFEVASLSCCRNRLAYVAVTLS